MNLHRIVVACAAWFVLIASGVWAAEFIDFYKLGLAAADEGQWTRSAEMMRQAIELQPEARAKVRKSLYFRRYLPHFYLGKALFEGGDCAGALAAWNESEAQGVVVRFPEYGQMEEGRLACQQMSLLEQGLVVALKAVGSAEVAAESSRRQLSSLSRDDETRRRLLASQDAAEEDLRQIRSRLGTGEATLAEVELLADRAVAVQTGLGAVEREARLHREVQLQRNRRDQVDGITPLIEAARAALETSEFLRPFPKGVAVRRAEVEQVLQQAGALDAGNLSPGEIETLRLALERSTRDLYEAISPPPSVLEAAVGSYLQGDYPGVLMALAESEFSDTRAATHAHLLKAAALFSLYQVTGGQDAALLESARAEMLALHRVAPEQRPPPSVFSPRFLEFFEQEVAALASPSVVSDPRAKVVDPGR